MSSFKNHPAIHKRFCLPSAVYLVIQENDKVLLLKRFNTGFEDDNYSVIAGCMDGNESVTDAVIREAKEEANITLQKEHLSPPTVMHRKGNSKHWEAFCFFFKASQYEGQITNNEPHKCSDLSFFSLDELPSNMIDYVKAGIFAVLEGKPFMEYEW
jgi:ADP-ribose pyrophosphatase YjhB (NUDIX family)